MLVSEELQGDIFNVGACGLPAPVLQEEPMVHVPSPPKPKSNKLSLEPLTLNPRLELTRQSATSG